MADADRDPPKQELLLKMLNMTTADNDGQALVAIRKANALLASAGWTWEKLLSGKITVVEDPFSKVAAPTAQAPRNVEVPVRPFFRPTPTPRPLDPSPPPRPQTPRPSPPPPPQPAKPYSTRTNNYGGWCYCCGAQVASLDGFIIKPEDYGARKNAITAKWQIICEPCNKSNAFVGPSPARRQTGQTVGASPDLYKL